MKTKLLTKWIAAAVLLGGSVSLGLAQDTNTNTNTNGWTCPFGNQPGYGRSAKFKQKNVQRTRNRNFGNCPWQGRGRGRGNGFGFGPGWGRLNGLCPWQNNQNTQNN